MHRPRPAMLGQYRTSNVIDSAIDKICINGSALIGHATFSPALDAAIANYNTQNLTFDMTRIAAPTGVGCDAVITVGLVGGATSSAGFPVGGLPYHTVSLASGTAGYGLAASTHTITHELGHCIGFRHADYYNRSISCGTGGNEGSTGVGAIHIPNTPTAAVNNGSIMNSCYGGGSTGVWTAEDIDALHQLYGRDCCAVGTGAGCGNVPVNECVGAFDPYCNDTQWDNLCVTEIATLSCGACPDLDHSCCSTGGAGCSDNFIEAAVCVGTLQSCCTVAWGQSCVAKVNELADSVGLPCDSTCCAPKDTAGCNSPSVQACVAAADPWCVNVKWDALCVDEVESLGCGHCP